MLKQKPMKLKKINKILKDPTTSKRLKKEINFLFERLEIVSIHRDILQTNKPVESTEELFGINNLLETFKTPKPIAGNNLQSTPQPTTNNYYDPTQHKTGEITVLKATKTMPSIITKGDLYYATSNDKYYFFNSVQGHQTQILKEDMKHFEVMEDPKYNPGEHRKKNQEPITASTLKSPKEWLKLMSEEERKQWEENIIKSNEMLNISGNMTFRFFIFNSFDLTDAQQGEEYWKKIANRYENQ